MAPGSTAQDPGDTSTIKALLIGFCLGTANIIPGVSGGTFLLVFKIYERVFSALNHINKASVLEFLALLKDLAVCRNFRASAAAFGRFLDQNDFIFLIKLIIGSVAAILCLSSLMKYLIVHQFTPTYALFFGLIFVSILVPVKMLEQRKAWLLFFILLGAGATVYVTMAVNPYDKVKFKSDFYQTQYETRQLSDPDEGGAGNQTTQGQGLRFTGKYRPNEYAYAALCGAVAISAMVLPGISGSLVLILMGEYFEVVSAISGLRTLNLDNMAFLGCFAVGIIFGGLLFAKLITAVLRRFYDATMAFLIGLMAGSLYALWPFKKSIVMAEQYVKTDGMIRTLENVRVYTNINELPLPGPGLYTAAFFFVLGCIIMSFFIEKEKTR